MALTNYERVKRWRDKHRALYNLRRRNARKNLPVPVLAEPTNLCVSKGETGVSARSATSDSSGEARGSTSRYKECSDTDRDSRGGQPSTIEQLRELIKLEEFRTPEERPAVPSTKPKVFFNDHGAQISEKVWNELQEKKRIAREAGYEFDPQ